MLTEEIIIDQITADENNNVHVRQATVIKKDGAELSRGYHRWVLSPGDDISQQDPKVQAVCNALWNN